MFVRHVKDVEKQKRADTNTSDESESECWESGESVWESGRADSQLEEEGAALLTNWPPPPQLTPAHHLNPINPLSVRPLGSVGPWDPTQIKSRANHKLLVLAEVLTGSQLVLWRLFIPYFPASDVAQE